ncbi:MAG: MBL fold metallo-hydrolase [Dehalococcoidales bacterium]|nr:MBL fold metallo-hydrolase [Dehalococcoidales bacterium]
MSNIRHDQIPAGQNVREIAPGIYQVRIPLSDGHAMALESMNSYLIQGTSGWLMIDTGWYQPFAFKALEDALHSLGQELSDIHTIALTHSHPDHYGMAGKIRQHAPKAELICHRWEADLIESRFIKFIEPKEDVAFLLEKHGVPEADIQPMGSASMPVLQLVTITLPDRLLYGGEIISTGIYDLEIIWTPGHSPGHICLYEPKNRLLFCGDNILPTITPNVGYHVLSGDNPLGDYLGSLNKLAHLDIACAHPGHEYSFTDIKGRIAEIIEHHRLRSAEVMELIAGNLSNSYEIAHHLTWSLKIPFEDFSPLQKRAAVTEAIAHLEYLRWEGRINKTYRNNRISYGN